MRKNTPLPTEIIILCFLHFGGSRCPTTCSSVFCYFS